MTIEASIIASLILVIGLPALALYWMGNNASSSKKN